VKLHPYTYAAIIATIFVIGIGAFAFIATDEASLLITGKSIAQAYIYQSPVTNCSLTLYQGANMVSFFCENGNTTIANSLRDINNNSIDVYAVYKYNPSNANDRWDIYNPSLPNYTTQQLSVIDRKYGYWVVMNNSDTYFRQGLKFSTTTTSLVQGWNLIGYPTNVNQSIDTALSTINSSFNIVESYQFVNSTGTWLVYYVNGSGNLTIMEPMRGYWINISNATSWTVDW